MKTVYKYELAISNIQELSLPYGAKILTVQVQHSQSMTGDVVCLWAEVDTEQPGKQPHTIVIYGTGQPIDAEHEHQYIGTFQLERGAFIGHVYEIFPNNS